MIGKEWATAVLSPTCSVEKVYEYWRKTIRKAVCKAIQEGVQVVVLESYHAELFQSQALRERIIQYAYVEGLSLEMDPHKRNGVWGHRFIITPRADLDAQ